MISVRRLTRSKSSKFSDYGHFPADSSEKGEEWHKTIRNSANIDRNQLRKTLFCTEFHPLQAYNTNQNFEVKFEEQNKEERSY